MIRKEPYLTVHAAIGELILNWSALERQIVVTLNFLARDIAHNKSPGRPVQPYKAPRDYNRRWQHLMRNMGQALSMTYAQTLELRRIRRQMDSFKKLRDDLGHGWTMVNVGEDGDVSLKIVPPLGSGLVAGFQRTYTKTLQQVIDVADGLRALKDDFTTQILSTLQMSSIKQIKPRKQNGGDIASRNSRIERRVSERLVVVVVFVVLDQTRQQIEFSLIARIAFTHGAPRTDARALEPGLSPILLADLGLYGKCILPGLLMGLPTTANRIDLACAR